MGYWGTLEIAKKYKEYRRIHEIHEIYENSVPQLFVPNILSFATEGKELFYGGVRTPLEFWAPWRAEEDASLERKLGLHEVGNSLIDLLSPERLLDILQNFSIFSSLINYKIIIYFFLVSINST